MAGAAPVRAGHGVHWAASHGLSPAPRRADLLTPPCAGLTDRMFFHTKQCSRLSPAGGGDSGWWAALSMQHSPAERQAAACNSESRSLNCNKTI